MQKEIRIKATISEIEKAIIQVIAFFDLFDHPLTAREVWSHLNIKGLTLREVWDFLDNSLDVLDSDRGFYFLKGREEIVDIRKERFAFSYKKIKKARKVARIFSFLPWIKMIAISNVIGNYNMKKESDIDLFIITGDKRVWISRFFCILIAMIFRWRPRPGQEEDKICLSFFISESAYDLEMFRFAPRDIYFTFWIVGLLPVYNIDYSYEKFIEANKWLRERLPNWRLKIEAHNHIKKPSRISSYFLRFFFGKFENLVRKFQVRIMPPQLKELINKDTRVVLREDIIKLHTKDRRLLYQEDFEHNYQKTLDLLK